jgi:hypothetical protein
LQTHFATNIITSTSKFATASTTFAYVNGAVPAQITTALSLILQIEEKEEELESLQVLAVDRQVRVRLMPFREHLGTVQGTFGTVQGTFGTMQGTFLLGLHDQKLVCFVTVCCYNCVLLLLLFCCGCVCFCAVVTMYVVV